MEDQENERRGFRVTDRRRFAETGEERGDAPPGPDSSPTKQTTEEKPAAAQGEEPVNFSTFVLGLSTQALLHLGEIPDPQTRQVARDLTAAKQVIDLLGVLKDKTRNNLEPAEDSLLESILYDLRLRYVELVRGGGKET